MSAAVIDLCSRTRMIRLTLQEEELLQLFRSTRSPEDMLMAARAIVERDCANRITMQLQRLSQGRLRSFWRDVPGEYNNFTGEVFESIENVIERATALLGDDHASSPAVFICTQARQFLQRSGSRVEVIFMPSWMCREWRQRAESATV